MLSETADFISSSSGRPWTLSRSKLNSDMTSEYLVDLRSATVLLRHVKACRLGRNIHFRGRRAKSRHGDIGGVTFEGG